MNITNLIKLIITNFKQYSDNDTISIIKYAAEGMTQYEFQGEDEVSGGIYDITIFVKEDSIEFNITDDETVWLNYTFNSNTPLNEKAVYDLIFTGTADKIGLVNELIKYFKEIEGAKLFFQSKDKYIYQFGNDSLMTLNLQNGIFRIVENDTGVGYIDLPTGLKITDFTL